MFKYIAAFVVAIGLLWAIGDTVKSGKAKTASVKVVTPEKDNPILIHPALLSAHQWEVKRAVEESFKDIPHLQRAAFCESSWKHTSSDGRIVRGRTTPNDIGVMQINVLVHGERLARLGLNPYNLKDNMRYARLLYAERGMKPWKATAHCWTREIIVASR